MKLIYCFMIFFCPLVSRGQTIKALTVGDKVPDIEFAHVINYKHSTARLSDFKGKLIILDFWASWCTTCVKGFPHSDSLQKHFKGRLQIILVNPKGNGDSLKQVTRVLGQFQKLTGVRMRMPVVLLDTVASAYFIFNEIPHCVWIKDGRVLAISDGEAVTAANIEAFLNGRDPGIPIKKDDLRLQ